MSFTKLEIAQRLLSILYPDTTIDSKLTTQEAMKAVSEARDEYVRNAILRNKNETNTVYGNWLSTFDKQGVKYDDVRCKWYCELPVGVISLPEDMGVYQAWYCNYPEDFLVPVSTGFMNRYRYSYAQLLEGKFGYYLAENRMYLLHDANEQTKLGMNLIAQSEDLGDYDFFPIDGASVQGVLERAVQLYQVQKQIPQDKLNDNVSQ